MLIPKTRKEIYWAYLSGETDLELPRPVTRDEIILYNACINGAGTNPSWNDIPDKPFGENDDGTITTIDPKYLPEDIGGGAGAFVVTFLENEDGSVYTPDKTFAETDAAISSGRVAIGRVALVESGVTAYRYCELCQYVAGVGMAFRFIDYVSQVSKVDLMVFWFMPDDSVTKQWVHLQLAP